MALFSHTEDSSMVDPGAVRLGLAVDPIVSLVSPHATVLYRECSLQLLAPRVPTLVAKQDKLRAEEHQRLLDTATVDCVLKALADDPQVVLGCNLSFSTLASASTCKKILQRILDDQHLAPRLVLGISEDWPLNEIAEVSSQLAAAKLMGCRLAILPTHPVSWRSSSVDIEWDIVRIDHDRFGSLFKDLRNDELCVLMAEAATLASTIVIDGIETQEHLEVARAAGASHGQGPFFGGRVFSRWFVETGDDSLQTLSLLAHSGTVVCGGEDDVA